MFKSAREIQDWFTECARIISSICRENVEWITPLGLPIVQPYMKQKSNIYIKERNGLVKVYSLFNKYYVLQIDFIV